MTAAGRVRAEPTRPYRTWHGSVRTVPSLSGPSRCRSAPPVSRPPPRLAVPARGGAGRQLRIAARAVSERVLLPELPRTDPPDPSRPRSVRPWATQSPSSAAPPPPVSALRWAPLAPGAPLRLPGLPQRCRRAERKTRVGPSRRVPGVGRMRPGGRWQVTGDMSALGQRSAQVPQVSALCSPVLEPPQVPPRGFGGFFSPCQTRAEAANVLSTLAAAARAAALPNPPAVIQSPALQNFLPIPAPGPGEQSRENKRLGVGRAAGCRVLVAFYASFFKFFFRVQEVQQPPAWLAGFEGS